MKEKINFRISTGLKSIIGRDLITDKFIAIFEIVKNSYDAMANNVNIRFEISDNKNEIIIQDDGEGMSEYDMKYKWLFVAYSEKKINNQRSNSYVNKIKRVSTGAKGIGRFSCDRLGSKLLIESKTKGDININCMEINWDNFEIDDKEEFTNIPVDFYTLESKNDLNNHWTKITICNLRENWSREDYLKLKQSLVKLIAPYENNNAGIASDFSIKLIVPSENQNDSNIISTDNYNDKDIVNGIIKNDILEILMNKTAYMNVSINSDGTEIQTELYDKDVLIFSLFERSREYRILNDINATIYFLSTSAKNIFSRRMGMRAVDYGSIFIYKNGFRIYPYGEPGNDLFNIDKRKQQGYNRYLGTREIIGYVLIKSNNDKFVETSSRANGFIQSAESKMLEKFFVEKILKVFEKYVTKVINWSDIDNVKTMGKQQFKDTIISLFVSTNKTDLIKYEINESFFKNNYLKSDNDFDVLIHKIENSSNKDDVITYTKKIRNSLIEISRSNKELEINNEEFRKKNSLLEEKSKIQDKQITNLINKKNYSVDKLLNTYHSIYIYSDTAKGKFEKMFSYISKHIDKNALKILVDLYKINENIHKLSDMIINSKLEIENNEHNISEFINKYIKENNDSNILISIDDENYICKFKQLELMLIIDNIISNAKKAGASKINVSFKKEHYYTKVFFSDNGVGLSKSIDKNRLFEFGYTYNLLGTGAGIGLYHIRLLMKDMDGSVEINENYNDGFSIVLEFKNE